MAYKCCEHCEDALAHDLDVHVGPCVVSDCGPGHAKVTRA